MRRLEYTVGFAPLYPPYDSLSTKLKMTAPVSYLFVPGNRPERFNKALSSGAMVDRPVLLKAQAILARAAKTAN